MTNVIDFQVERAIRKSGIKDKVLLKDIIDEGYDPCDPIEVSNYYQWKDFEGGISAELEHNWTDEAINNLLADIKNFDPNQPYTVTVANDGGVPFNTIEHLGNLFSENDTEKG